MIIGVCSQNLRTVTGHAGKTRKFKIYKVSDDGIEEIEPLSLPKEMSMHEFRGGQHPIDGFDVLITAGCGEGFLRRMASRGVKVLATSEVDPLTAVNKVVSGETLPGAETHPDHSH